MVSLTVAKDIKIQQWIRQGGMLYNTDGLEIEHDMHPYNQALAQGVIPEEYGIHHPYALEFMDKTRDQLIAEVVQLRKQVEALERYI